MSQVAVGPSNHVLPSMNCSTLTHSQVKSAINSSHNHEELLELLRGALGALWLQARAAVRAGLGRPGRLLPSSAACHTAAQRLPEPCRHCEAPNSVVALHFFSAPQACVWASCRCSAARTSGTRS